MFSRQLCSCHAIFVLLNLVFLRRYAVASAVSSGAWFVGYMALLGCVYSAVMYLIYRHVLPKITAVVYVLLLLLPLDLS